MAPEDFAQEAPGTVACDRAAEAPVRDHSQARWAPGREKDPIQDKASAEPALALALDLQVGVAGREP